MGDCQPSISLQPSGLFGDPSCSHKFALIVAGVGMQIEGLRQCMTELGYWGSGPVQRKEGLTTPNLMQLVGALEGVVELCCKVARMEGLEMNAILKRTELS